jgi:hypothetical protein
MLSDLKILIEDISKDLFKNKDLSTEIRRIWDEIRPSEELKFHKYDEKKKNVYIVSSDNYSLFEAKLLSTSLLNSLNARLGSSVQINRLVFFHG